MYNFPIGVILESFRTDRSTAIKKAAAMGAKGIQMYATTGENAPENLNAQARRALLDEVKGEGMVFSALCGDLGMGFGHAEKNPALIEQAAKRYGDQCVVLSADIKRVDGVFRVFSKGGRENTGMEAISWIKRCVDSGAGEVVVNSIDTDGVKGGFDLEMLKAVCNVVNVPVIASGGAGNIDHFIKLFKTLPKVDAGLAASIFHFGEVKISDLKNEMKKQGIPAR